VPGDEYHVITNSASIGCALPAAIGAASANDKNATVIAIMGDGGFQMSAMELMTAKNYGIKVINIVLVNGILGPISAAFSRKSLPQVACTFKNPDFVKLGQAFGIPAWRVQTLADCKTALQRGLEADTSCIIAVEYS